MLFIFLTLEVSNLDTSKLVTLHSSNINDISVTNFVLNSETSKFLMLLQLWNNLDIFVTFSVLNDFTFNTLTFEH